MTFQCTNCNFAGYIESISLGAYFFNIQKNYFIYTKLDHFAVFHILDYVRSTQIWSDAYKQDIF